MTSHEASYGRSAWGFALLLALMALFAGGKAVLYDTLDPDCFWHLKVADQLHAQGIGPLVDQMSFASDKKPWTPYSWLAELAMHGVWQTGGYRAAVAATALMMVALVVLMGWACAIVAGSSGLMAALVATAFATYLSLAYLSFRPVTAALVFLALVAALLLRDRARGERTAAVWTIVPITALLANVHLYAVMVPLWVGGLWIGAWWERCARTGTFATANLRQVSSPPATAGKLRIFDSRTGEGPSPNSAGIPAEPSPLPSPGVPGEGEKASSGRGGMEEDGSTGFTAGLGRGTEGTRRLWRYGWMMLLAGAACMATPMAPGMLAAMVHYQFSDPMVHGPIISEMQPITRGVGGLLVAAATGLTLWRWKRVRVGEWLWLALGLALLLQLGRWAPVYAMIGAPVLAGALRPPGPLSDRALGKPVVIAACALVLAVGLVRIAASFPRSSLPMAQWLNRNSPPGPGYPTAAVDFVANSVKPRTGRLINEFTWGGYLEWRLGDRWQVLMDGRTQIFDASFWEAAYLSSPQQAKELLAKTRADAAILPAARSRFHDGLSQLGWTSAYRDQYAEVMLPPRAIALAGD